VNKIGRKIYHLTGGLALIALYVWLGRPAGLMVLTGIFVFATSLDLIRLRSASLNRFFFTHFKKFIRDSEQSKLTGTPWYVLGILVSAAVYGMPVAAYCVAFLACGDVAATSVGEKWGSIKIARGKSLQGSIAFFVASAAAALIMDAWFVPMDAGVFMAGAAAAAVVEVVPVSINDNLSVPVISGAVMQLLLTLSL
jgi:glycerol-3-phosphate acyltransferase PlsY